MEGFRALSMGFRASPTHRRRRTRGGRRSRHPRFCNAVPRPLAARSRRHTRSGGRCRRGTRESAAPRCREGKRAARGNGALRGVRGGSEPHSKTAPGFCFPPEPHFRRTPVEIPNCGEPQTQENHFCISFLPGPYWTCTHFLPSPEFARHFRPPTGSWPPATYFAPRHRTGSERPFGGPQRCRVRPGGCG